MPPIGKDLCPDRTMDGCKQAQTLGNRRHSSTLSPKHGPVNCCHNRKLHCPSFATQASTQRASPWFDNSTQCIYPDRSFSIDLPLPRPSPGDNTQSTGRAHWFDLLTYRAQRLSQSIAPTIPQHYTTHQYSPHRHALSPPMPYQCLDRCRAPSHPNNGFPTVCECAILPLPPPMLPPRSW